MAAPVPQAGYRPREVSGNGQKLTQAIWHIAYRSRTCSDCVAFGVGDVSAIVSLAIRRPCAVRASAPPEALSVTATVASCPGRNEKVPRPIVSSSVVVELRRPLRLALLTRVFTVSVSLPAHLREAVHRSRILALPRTILSVVVMTSTARGVVGGLPGRAPRRHRAAGPR